MPWCLEALLVYGAIIGWLNPAWISKPREAWMRGRASNRPRWPVGLALMALLQAGPAGVLPAGEEPGTEKNAGPAVPGEKAPEFTLPDETGRSHSLSEGLERGPLALIFFRGVW